MPEKQRFTIDGGPPDVDGFSEPEDVMGTASYGVRDNYLWGGGLLALGVIFMLVLSLVPVRAGREPPVMAGVIVFAVFEFGSLYWWRDLWRIKDRLIWLFPEGVVETCRGKVKAFRWDDVAEFTYWVGVSDLAMRNTDGQQLDFCPLNIDRADELGDAVVEGVAEVLAPKLAERIQSGETVSFGRIEGKKPGIVIHYKAYKSKQPRSFYRGPWPRSENVKGMASAYHKETAKVRWKDILGLEEDEDCVLTLNTTGGRVPLYCQPTDAPNSSLIPVIAEIMREQTGENDRDEPEQRESIPVA